MHRASVLLVAVTTAFGLVQGVASAASNATVEAPFSQTRGLSCAVDTDCGYVPSLACVDGRCDYCRPGRFDCGEYPGDLSKHCQLMFEASDASAPLYSPDASHKEAQAAYCVEKDLFSHFGWRDAVGTLVAFVSTAIGSGCGIGGGGLMVPLYIFVMGLSPKHAIPLSKATILGNAVAIYLYNFNRKHPTNQDMPIINHAVAAVMEPMTLLGTVFGVMLNKTLPNWSILALLIALLAFITYNTAVKGLKLHQRESEGKLKQVKAVLSGSQAASNASRWSVFPRLDAAGAARKWLAITRRNRKAREARQQDVADFASLPPLPPHHLKQHEAQSLLSNQQHSFGTFDTAGDDDVWTSTRRSIQHREASRFPLSYIWPLAVSWLIVLAQSLLRGGHGAPSIVGVPCGSNAYWLLTLLPLVLLVAITAFMGRQLRLLSRLKVLSGFEFKEGDTHWVRYRVVALPALCIIAGIAAGLLGIGGGIVKGPILLEMGMLPAVQSATTSFMILFTSSSTTLQFAINGQFPGDKQLDYALWFIGVGFLGGLTGQHVVALLVRRFKRESIIVLLLAATIGLSATAMGLVSFQSTLRDVQQGVHLGLGGLCTDA